MQFSKDGRLNPTHISLYLALFQLWNNYHFPEEFYINRQEVMRFSKIGSKSTYHKCIKELSHWNYLLYIPSHNPFRGSQIKMFQFGTSPEQVLCLDHTNFETSNEQVIVSKIKQEQTIQNNNKRQNQKKIDLKDIDGKKQNEVGLYEDNLKTSLDKNYNDPL